MWVKFVTGPGLCANFLGVDVLVFCCFLMSCSLVKVVASGTAHEVSIQGEDGNRDFSRICLLGVTDGLCPLDGKDFSTGEADMRPGDF